MPPLNSCTSPTRRECVDENDITIVDAYDSAPMVPVDVEGLNSINE